MKKQLNPKEIAEASIALLEEIHHLLELKGENPFKIRAFEKAAKNLSGQLDLKERAQNGTLTEITGIGKGIAEILVEFILKGTSQARDELLASLPQGLIELTRVPGLGPKRALQLIEALEVHSLSELEYACRENRLIKLKGFGEKVQQKILEGIRFLNAGQGQIRLGDALGVAEKLLPLLLTVANSGRHPLVEKLRVSETGALRRRSEILSELEFLVEVPPGEKLSAQIRKQVEERVEQFRSEENFSLPIRFIYSIPTQFGYALAQTTGTDRHWRALKSPAPFEALTENEFYRSLDLPWIWPEAREAGEEVALARQGQLKELLLDDGVRGVFHNHTSWSDGEATVEEMVIAAKSLGYQYIGISDHSQSAFYAHGLGLDELLKQEREIRSVQEKHPEIRIFWGIESDILQDGSLDYEAKILKRFDFTVASVHSRFKMDKGTMTARILKAIRNPHTRFLGHATGRLLLGRPGYDVDMEALIIEAAKCNVAIEINSHPSRLDIDWRWGGALREHQTWVSINPDAHEVAGLRDVRFGIMMARKALLPTSQVVNSKGVKEVGQWLNQK